jgi:hypothetical protein
VTVAVPVPTLFVAMMVYSVADTVTVGVPEITQVVELIESPVGRVVRVLQASIEAP